MLRFFGAGILFITNVVAKIAGSELMSISGLLDEVIPPYGLIKLSYGRIKICKRVDRSSPVAGSFAKIAKLVNYKTKALSSKALR